jgi:hypothetical protein
LTFIDGGQKPATIGRANGTTCPDHPMNNVCVTTVVDAAYMEYAPLFTYCMKMVYPAFKTVIVLRDDCPYDLNGAESIRLFADFPRYPYLPIALRFVVPPDVYKQFDYVYITDIDMMIMPERLSLDEFHLAEMVATGLCFSNSLRNVHHYAGFESLSGLHFANRKWFAITEERRAFYYNSLKAGLLGLYREYDGVMLYRMAKDSGCGLPKKYKLKKRHHGIHLGNFRLFSNRDQWADRIPVDYRTQWMQFMGDKKFRAMVEEGRRNNTMLNEQLGLLENFIKNP